MSGYSFMQKTILITGSSDGIGLAAAKAMAARGQCLLLHGRNAKKLQRAQQSVSAGVADKGSVECYLADFSLLSNVEAVANAVTAKHHKLDVLINNAGVFKSATAVTEDGLDVRFAVNTLAPYLLTKRLMPLLGASARVVNVCSAAQSPVNLDALAGKLILADEFKAYAQSKLAMIMWSRRMALSSKNKGPSIIAVNPGSLLGTKMVKEGFGIAGKDIAIGANILTRLALDDELAAASGEYFDNDSGQFAPPHRDALNPAKCEALVQAIEAILKKSGFS